MHSQIFCSWFLDLGSGVWIGFHSFVKERAAKADGPVSFDFDFCRRPELCCSHGSPCARAGMNLFF
jgi:hypothetical protein